jgi:hypothetical protein
MHEQPHFHSIQSGVDAFIGQINNDKSPAIQRLIDEVRNKDGLSASPGKYDRTHNRHNRGQ